MAMLEICGYVSGRQELLHSLFNSQPTVSLAYYELLIRPQKIDLSQ